MDLYLTLFERQIQNADSAKRFWVSYPVGQLPNSIARIVSGEDEEIADHYDCVKIFRGRLTMTPEKCRTPLL
ncbi:hypothetical protein CEXT_382441 [Caerostris extrusa]|uniref:Uncharacterized protein n=1 Tax=Caerostris extrusa TaxID=172846 RepID=A0AAV4PPN1_CAEEX|nr:hypothetical protein CEXT_382441 [Caerostris extrusa]